MEPKINKQQIVSLVIGGLTLLILITSASFAYLGILAENSSTSSTLMGSFAEKPVGTITLTGGGTELYLGVSVKDMGIGNTGAVYYSSHTVGGKETTYEDTGKATYTATLSGDDTNSFIYACDYEFTITSSGTMLDKESLGDVEVIFEGDIDKTVSLQSGSEKVSGTWYGIRTRNAYKDFNIYLKLENKFGNQSDLAGSSLSVSIDNSNWNCYASEQANSNGDVFATVNGTNTITIDNNNGEYLYDFIIKGNSKQDGIPSPLSPIEVESVGDKTVNVFDMSQIKVGEVSNKATYITEVYENGFKIKTPENYTGNGYLNTGVKLKELCPDVVPGEVYTLSFEYSMPLERLENAMYMNNLGLWYSGQSKTITEKLLEEYVVFYGKVTSGAENIISNVSLVRGTEVVDYEPYGQYKIPITVSGKNLFNINSGFSENVSSYSTRIDGNDIIVPSTSDGNSPSAVFKQLIPILSNKQYTFNYILKQGSPRVVFRLYDKTKTLILDNSITLPGFYYNEYYKGYFTGSTSITMTFPENVKYIQIATVSMSRDDKIDNIYSDFQFVMGSTVPEYEPYVESITTNIYLNEPLRKIGDDYDYIDFKNRIVVRKIKRFELEMANNLYPWSGKNGVHFANKLDGKYKRNEKALSNRNSYWSTDATYANPAGMWLGVDNNYVYWTGILDVLGFTTLNEINTWLAANPTYVLYSSDNPSTDTIDLPLIPTIGKTNIVSVNTSLSPSNFEVVYFK